MKHNCQIDKTLKQASLRCTQDRHDLFFLFLQNRAWSVSQIAKIYPKKDLSTIYRNVQKFVSTGLVTSIHTHAQEEFFELNQPSHHDHRACPECHLLTCVPCPISSFNQQHLLEIQEVCEACL